jgi:hypothetical protein
VCPPFSLSSFCVVMLLLRLQIIDSIGLIAIFHPRNNDFFHLVSL